MNRSKRMQPVAELAGKRADTAAKNLADQRRRVEEQKSRLEQLVMFRNEYRSLLHNSAELGMDAYRLRDYRAFIARIDSAIKQQQDVVVRGEQQTQRTEGQWAQAWGRARALNNVVDRYRSDERRAEDRREQQQVEESMRRPVRGLDED